MCRRKLVVEFLNIKDINHMSQLKIPLQNYKTIKKILTQKKKKCFKLFIIITNN